MKIPVKDEDKAFYEKRPYGFTESGWCLTRNGEVIRWLDFFEARMIESVLEYGEG